MSKHHYLVRLPVDHSLVHDANLCICDKNFVGVSCAAEVSRDKLILQKSQWGPLTTRGR
jgi:hypothetical protein